MQEERGQSWRIHVTTKARNFSIKFRFRFNATSFTPTCCTLSSCRLSIVLKLRKFILRINSQPTTTQPKDNGGGFLKAKVMKIVHKFQARLAKNRSTTAVKLESHLLHPKDPIPIGLWVVGFLIAFVAQCVIKNNNQKRVMMVASAGVFVASLLFKTFKTAKLVKLATLPLVLAAIVCYLYFQFYNSYCWDYIAWSWCAWNKLAKV